ncbi:exodeoxyribonuclease VII large subunit, partial [bacterium]|nr:exodeoxyribonuclease VII large subunit [bacterium]
MTDPTPLTVAEVTSRIKVVVEGSLPPLWVRGEISQFTKHRSGHWYFTLSDEKSVLPCVLWRGRAAEAVYVPQAGDQVMINGRVTVYERGGRYQFDCFEVRPAGVG